MAQRLTQSDVERTAALARLELTSDEIMLFADQLSAILSYVEQVQGVDTPEASATSAAETGAALREDTPRGSVDRDTLLSQAPDSTSEFFKVPRVLGS